MKFTNYQKNKYKNNYLNRINLKNKNISKIERTKKVIEDNEELLVHTYFGFTFGCILGFLGMLFKDNIININALIFFSIIQLLIIPIFRLKKKIHSFNNYILHSEVN